MHPKSVSGEGMNMDRKMSQAYFLKMEKKSMNNNIYSHVEFYVNIFMDSPKRLFIMKLFTIYKKIDFRHESLDVTGACIAH